MKECPDVEGRAQRASDLMRILVVTSAFYFPPRGADEADRVDGLRQFLRLGHEVKVLTRSFEFHIPHIELARRHLQIPIEAIPYRSGFNLPSLPRARLYAKRLRPPFVLDGSAWEFCAPAFLESLRGEILRWKPGVVFVDGTFGWPAAKVSRSLGVRTVMRSLNFEPSHVLQEHRHAPSAYLRAAFRLTSELRAIRYADRMLAISPKEAAMYKRLGARNLRLLPLRSLPKTLRDPPSPSEKEIIDAFFMGSTFNVEHMRAALDFLLAKVVPLVNERWPGGFRFTVFGGKVPPAVSGRAAANVSFSGFVDDLDSAMSRMDVAVVPSLFGGGMQQKVFEPLCRGIPTITSPRGLAGYPLVPGRHVALASRPNEFAEALGAMREPSMRKKLSRQSSVICRRLFSAQVLDEIVTQAIVPE